MVEVAVYRRNDFSSCSRWNMWVHRSNMLPSPRQSNLEVIIATVLLFDRQSEIQKWSGSAFDDRWDDDIVSHFHVHVQLFTSNLFQKKMKMHKKFENTKALRKLEPQIRDPGPLSWYFRFYPYGSKEQGDAYRKQRSAVFANQDDRIKSAEVDQKDLFVSSVLYSKFHWMHCTLLDKALLTKLSHKCAPNQKFLTL